MKKLEVVTTCKKMGKVTGTAARTKPRKLKETAGFSVKVTAEKTLTKVSMKKIKHSKMPIKTKTLLSKFSRLLSRAS